MRAKKGILSYRNEYGQRGAHGRVEQVADELLIKMANNQYLEFTGVHRSRLKGDQNRETENVAKAIHLTEIRKPGEGERGTALVAAGTTACGFAYADSFSALLDWFYTGEIGKCFGERGSIYHSKRTLSPPTRHFAAPDKVTNALRHSRHLRAAF